MKKLMSLILAVICAAGIVTFSASANAASSSYESQLISAGFPASYASKLVALKEKYPNWEFQPMYVGVDLDEAVANERTPHSQQLIQKTSSNNSKNYYCTCSSCYKNGNYVIQEGSTWVSASESAVEYYMNPLNFLDEKYIFQFETTAYDSAQSTTGIETIIKNTWMYNSYITYKDQNGKTQTYKSSVYPNGVKYSQAILDAAKSSGTSAYYLASRIVQEVGGTTNSAGGASGTNSTYPGIYNYYNIGANTGYLDGLKWASTSSSTTNCNAILRQGPTTSSLKIITVPNGTAVTIKSTTNVQADGYKWHQVSVTVNSKSYTGYIRSDLIDTNENGDKYNRPWTNPYLSIVNGAKYIANNFSDDQNTGYLQKFNVNPESSNMYSHEYMANIQAPSSESSNTYKAYSEANLLSAPKTFIIPVYENFNSVITGINVYGRGNGGTDLYLKWDAVTGADSYEIYIINNGQSILKGTSNSPNFVFTDLTPSYEYDVLIIANNKNQSSSGIFTVCAAPAPVENFDVQLIDSDTFYASWDAVNCHGYYIQWSKDKNFSQITGSVYISGGSTENYSMNLPDAEKYYFRMRAWKSFNGAYVYSDFSSAADLLNKLYMPSGFNVYARGDGGTDLYLDWNDVPEAVGYKIYIVSGNSETLESTVTESQYTFTDLTPSWEYDIRVEAYNSSKTSQAIYRISAAPAPAGNFSAEIVNEDTVQLSWDSVSCHGYYVQWATDENFTENTGGVFLTYYTTTQYTMNFENADEYYVRVRAWKIFNNTYVYSDFSDPVNLKVMLPPVKDLKVTSYSDDGTELTLDWNDVLGADGYKIYFVNGEQNIYQAEVSESNYTLTGLIPGSEYRVLVEAYSNSGRSSNSAISVCAGLSAVDDIYLITDPSGSITVTWSKVNCNGYSVEWATDSDFTKNKGSAETDTESYTFGDSYSKDYYVRIRAWKELSTNKFYGDYSEIIKLSDALSTPTGFNVYARGDGGTDLYLDWDDVAGADGYRVYTNCGTGDILKGDVKISQFTFTDLTPAWEYDAKVVAYNETGEASAVYRICAAPAPTDSLKAGADNNTITATWVEQASHGYYIQWSTDETFTNNVSGAFINGSASTSYTINVANAQDYYVRVRAWKWYQDSRVYSDFCEPVKPSIALTAPTGFNVYARGDGGTDLYLDWDDVAGADGYRVYTNCGTGDILKGDVKNSQFTFTDLTPAWEYDAKIVAYNEEDEVSAVYRICAAPAPTDGLKASATGNAITATWVEQASHGYYIQWSTDKSFTKNVSGAFINGSGSTSYTINVANAQDYYVRVRAWKWYQDSRVYSDFCEPVSVSK